MITIIVLSLLGGSLLLKNQYEGARVFNIHKKTLDTFNKKTDGFFLFYANLSKYIGVGILPIILFYFGTLEYLSGNIYWTILVVVLIFQTFIWSAMNFSFDRVKEIVPVDIYFSNASIQPLVGVRILKINNDNIRVRSEDKILILNKNEVSKIEMKIPERYL